MNTIFGLIDLKYTQIEQADCTVPEAIIFLGLCVLVAALLRAVFNK